MELRQPTLAQHDQNDELTRARVPQTVCVRRGKLLNVREASASQVTGNVEIQAIKQILGLQHGKVRRERERTNAAVVPAAAAPRHGTQHPQHPQRTPSQRRLAVGHERCCG